MINGESVLAVIPARGGSKRCPRKNIKEFRGKPLIAWSIETAMEAINDPRGYLDVFYVSTEDNEIADIANQTCLNSGQLCIKRPPELATDDASNEDVLRHALKLYPHDWVILLQPTSPLRTVDDIFACLERAAASEVNNGCISYSEGNWQKNGAVYVARREWIEKHDFGHAGLLKYWMPADRSLDIDYPEQFQE